MLCGVRSFLGSLATTRSVAINFFLWEFGASFLALLLCSCFGFFFKFGLLPRSPFLPLLLLSQKRFLPALPCHFTPKTTTTTTTTAEAKRCRHCERQTREHGEFLSCAGACWCLALDAALLLLIHCSYILARFSLGPSSNCRVLGLLG